MLFAVCKDLEEDIQLTMDLRQFAGYRLIEHTVLHDEDLHAINTEADPDRIYPTADGNACVENGMLTATLKHKSWNMIRLGR